MIPIRRRPSFRQYSGGLIACGVLLTVLLIASAPFGTASPLFPYPALFLAAHAPFLLILWSFGWCGPLWGLGTTAWAVLFIGMVGLSSREAALLWLPAGFVLFAIGVHRQNQRWQGAIREGTVRVDRLSERLNTLTEELKKLQETESAIHKRLRRYQQLRQVANAFNLSLPLEDLMDCIVRASGDLIHAADHVLLYLVDPGSLHLELKKVWRRSGSVTIKAKRGDAFDEWVLRQGQPLLVEETAHDFRFPQMTPEKLGRKVGSVLAVPLVTEHRLLGVLRLESVFSRALESDDLRLIRILGDLASLGIENSTLYSRMAELAVTDDLTGLAVRGLLEKKLQEEIARSAKIGSPVSILLIDIDRFKVYNDSFGHSAGDKLLRQIAGALLQLRRPGDVAARFGGEEFVCLYPGVGSDEAIRRAEEIRLRVETTSIELRRAITRITVSIGVATFPEDGKTMEALLERADHRLYQAKDRGRNQVCHSD